MKIPQIHWTPTNENYEGWFLFLHLKIMTLETGGYQSVKQWLRKKLNPLWLLREGHSEALFMSQIHI